MQSIVDAMGGEIGVDSKVGNGSTFWFTLPYHTGTANESTDKPVELSELSKDKQITILIAEDDESNYRLFHSILQKDFQLIHARDGKEAVELYSLHHPNLILMDINMPNMNGYEATHQIRELSKAYQSSQLRHTPMLRTNKNNGKRIHRLYVQTTQRPKAAR